MLGLTAAAVLASPQTAEADFSVQRVAAGVNQPIFVTHAPGRPNDLFIVERTGAIRIMDIRTNQINPTPFLTIPDVNTSGEGALIGLAFHPDFETNGKFYVNLTTSPDVPSPTAELTSHIREYTVTDLLGNPDTADPTPRTILRFDQPSVLHNGGWIGFDPTADNSNLYVMFGDGGDSNDIGDGHTPGTGNAQDITDNFMGKVLRIDVDGDDFIADTARNYAIPTDNPFVGQTGDDEIFAYGLRNPFRASFDRATGDLYIGDVGQSAFEEINLIASDSAGGENFGWRLREGDAETPTPGIGGPEPADYVAPLYAYGHGPGTLNGSSVTGGIVYRGPVTELQGQYIFGDFIAGKFWSLDPADPYNTVGLINDDLVANNGSANSVAAFGEDALGNLYLVDLGGEIFRVGLTADLNGDGFVGVDDLNIVLSNWNNGIAPGSLTGDLDGNGFVGVDDLNIILANWNMDVTPGDSSVGDTNGDGFVGVDDLNTILTQWNTGISQNDLLPGDLTGDGFVGVDDLNTILSHWNDGTPRICPR